MKEQCNELWKNIHICCFALTDMMLYLDTHPSDTVVLEQYIQLKNKYAELIDEYTCQYSPITPTQVHSNNCFSWASTPMPWEMEVYA